MVLFLKLCVSTNQVSMICRLFLILILSSEIVLARASGDKIHNAVIGRSIQYNQTLTPVGDDGTYSLLVGHNVRFQRFHFVVLQNATKSDWTVEIRDRSKRVAFRYTPDSRSDFWSSEIADGRAEIVLKTTQQSRNLRLQLREVIVSTDEDIPQAICTLRPFSKIVDQPNAMQNVGRSIVRIDFRAPGAGADVPYETCTGFFITEDTIITNEHCIASQEVADSAQIDLDANLVNSQCAPDVQDGDRCRAVLNPKFLWSDHDLDFSLLSLSDVKREALPLAPTAPMDSGASLLVVQHPGGEIKQISDGCSVIGLDGVEPNTDFSHNCNTDGGSSGSPVLDPTKRVVLGLHHEGYLQCMLPNQAVKIRAIIEAIRSRDQVLASKMKVIGP